MLGSKIQKLFQHKRIFTQSQTLQKQVSFQKLLLNKPQNFNKLYLIAPLLLFGYYQNQNIQCFFGKGVQYTKNKIEQRVVLLQYAANKPIEDRYQATQLNSIKGYAITVFDGHGGWQLAEYASKRIHQLLDEIIEKNKEIYSEESDLIQKSIDQAYEQIEQDFYQIAINAYNAGFPKLARVGACALTAVVVNNKVYSANLGDCKGIIVNPQTEQFKKINRMLNANSKKEQVRLRQQYTQDQDIVVCRGKGACYVKNRLQPTRSLGDFRLKYAEFNNPRDESEEKGYSARIQNYNGPYISATPEFKVVELEKGDRYLVLGSDGLWDELTKKDVAQVNQKFDFICQYQIVKKHQGNKNDLIKSLYEEAFAHAAKEANMKQDQLKQIPLGKRRKLHDDITIIVVDLLEQTN